jgi:hypothetical protein
VTTTVFDFEGDIVRHLKWWADCRDPSTCQPLAVTIYHCDECLSFGDDDESIGDVVDNWHNAIVRVRFILKKYLPFSELFRMQQLRRHLNLHL